MNQIKGNKKYLQAQFESNTKIKWNKIKKKTETKKEIRRTEYKLWAY